MPVRELLIEALLASEKPLPVDRDTAPSAAPELDTQFYAPLFITEWFRKRGCAYFFLFKKNLRVTNIQFAELLALVRHFAKPSDEEIIRDLQFLSVNEFNESVTKIVGAFRRDPANPIARHRTVADLYLPLFRRTLVITNFFGSCAVFIPPGLRVDLQTLCSHAGYIHSCGRNVYMRNAYKSTKDEFFLSLEAHFDLLPCDKRTFFTVYAHEDFTDYDRKQAADLRHGLDDVKVFVEKFYMGSDPLVAVIQEMRDKYRDRLAIPDPGDFRRVHPELRAHEDVDRSRTIWLIIDHGIEPSLRNPAEKFYFICYDQQWINENPFHIFDENKPAWVNHTTIPHTLMGAMLNITAPGWPRSGGHLMIGDPFVGTGTTWLEGLKYETAAFDCGDVDLIAPMLARDNLEFFGASIGELESVERLLGGIEEDFPTDPEPNPNFERLCDTAYRWAEGVFKTLGAGPNTDVYSFPSELITELATKDLGHRVLFYLCLRRGLRHRSALQRGSTRWKQAYLKEVGTMREQIRRLLDLRKKERDGEHALNFCSFNGDYSRACSISRVHLANLADGKVPVSVRDARKLEEGKYDVLITDPPYGFNTEGDPLELSKLYCDVIEIMLKALKEEGQLVIALPDWSHTGRQVPFYALKELVLQQILVTSERLNREVISGGYMAPPPGNIFRPPYYWESERALRRAILHFRVRTLPA